MAKAFCKFMGSKSRLLEEIRKRLPDKFDCYHEPFIGTASVYFDLAEDVLKDKKCYISDRNRELVNCLRVIRTNPDGLLNNLIRMSQMFYAGDLNEKGVNEDYYYLIRGADRNKGWVDDWPKEDRAARVIFLLKAGYNGRWRENSSGQNNVPIGDSRSKIAFADFKTIHACSEILRTNNPAIGHSNFITNRITSGDFAYLDPPYVPENPKSEFYNYSPNRFGMKQQKALARYCEYLDYSGIKFLLSNSDTDVTRQLYSKYYIDTVVTRRSVNCKAEGRGDKTEIMVRNYEL